jgi:hypothetical protein
VAKRQLQKSAKAKPEVTTLTAGGLHRKTVYFTDAEWSVVRQAAFDSQLTISEVVRAAVRKHFNMPEGPEIRRGPRPGGSARQ